ncbi:MAG: hypothetical protein ACM336_03305 [Acidobacteriota bacterium]
MKDLMRRLDAIEAKLGDPNDKRLVRALARATQGNAAARAELERLCASDATFGGCLKEVVEAYLSGPVPAPGDPINASQ